MSIDQPTTIDAIELDKKTGALHLRIVDHLPWDFDHLIKLQDKINRYLAYIESGEIFSAYPDAAEWELVIDLMLTYRPNEQASAFLQQAAAAIEDAGFLLRHGPAQIGYVDDRQ
jgi:hypothetical protein